MDDPTPVRACLCYPHTFAELKERAQERGWKTVADITRETGCGGGCGLCRPYLARMLATGQTAFAVLNASDEQSMWPFIFRREPAEPSRTRP